MVRSYRARLPAPLADLPHPELADPAARRARAAQLGYWLACLAAVGGLGRLPLLGAGDGRAAALACAWSPCRSPAPGRSRAGRSTAALPTAPCSASLAWWLRPRALAGLRRVPSGRAPSWRRCDRFVAPDLHGPTYPRGRLVGPAQMLLRYPVAVSLEGVPSEPGRQPQASAWPRRRAGGFARPAARRCIAARRSRCRPGATVIFEAERGRRTTSSGATSSCAPRPMPGRSTSSRARATPASPTRARSRWASGWRRSPTRSRPTSRSSASRAPSTPRPTCAARSPRSTRATATASASRRTSPNTAPTSSAARSLRPEIYLAVRLGAAGGAGAFGGAARRAQRRSGGRSPIASASRSRAASGQRQIAALRRAEEAGLRARPRLPRCAPGRPAAAGGADPPRLHPRPRRARRRRELRARRRSASSTPTARSASSPTATTCCGCTRAASTVEPPLAGRSTPSAAAPTRRSWCSARCPRRRWCPAPPPS